MQAYYVTPRPAQVWRPRRRASRDAATPATRITGAATCAVPRPPRCVVCAAGAACSALRRSAEAPRRARGSSMRRRLLITPRRQLGQHTPRAVSWTASTPGDTRRLRTSAAPTTPRVPAALVCKQRRPRSSPAWRARACSARSPRRRRAVTRQRRVRSRHTSPTRRALTRVPAARRSAEGAGQQAFRSRTVPRSDRGV